MNKSLTGILLLLTFTAFAQEKAIQELTYCGKTFQVPENCSATSEYELACDDFVIQWLYMNGQMLETMPLQFVDQLEDNLRKMKKKPIACSSFGQPLNAFKISYRNKRETHYKIVAYGPVNGQPVMIIVTLLKEPLSNESLPEFVKQVITLEET